MKLTSQYAPKKERKKSQDFQVICVKSKSSLKLLMPSQSQVEFFIGVSQVSLKSSNVRLEEPLLYSLYINDLPESCPGAGCQLHADDTVIYASAKTSSEAAETLSSFLSRVCHWLYDNKLTLNNKKTVSMCFAIKNTPQSEDFCMTLQGEEIEMVKDFKYLGVVLDCFFLIKTFGWFIT